MMTVPITSFNFRIGERIVNISYEDAQSMYVEFTDRRLFGVNIGLPELKNVHEITATVKLRENQYVEMHIHELKDLYYTLKDIFGKNEKNER
jgi:hypothetical protein